LTQDGHMNARAKKTPKSRADDVAAAYSALASALHGAEVATASYGPDDQRTRDAWALLEAHGATIHRQSRILAGKSRGG
jgi:hypothetical protein